MVLVVTTTTMKTVELVALVFVELVALRRHSVEVVAATSPRRTLALWDLVDVGQIAAYLVERLSTYILLPSYDLDGRVDDQICKLRRTYSLV